MSKRDNFGRCNSICPTPQSILLGFVKTNDARNIERLVRTNPVLLDYVYKGDYYKPILLIACSEKGIRARTVETLIDLGADLMYSSEVDNDYQAIHFAALNANKDILEAIVNKLKPGQINTSAKGNNALHVLLKQAEYGNNLQECVAILIKAGIDVNQGDDNNISPILWAAKKGYKEVIKLLLEEPSLNVDIDSHRSRGKCARDLILEKSLYDGSLPGPYNNNNDNYGKILFVHLKTGNENGFINFKNGDIDAYVNELDDDDGGSYNLLQFSCDRGLTRATKHLLDKGADPNARARKNEKYPIEIAADHGFFEIFSELLNHPQIDIPNTILIRLLKNIDNLKTPQIDHEKCYTTLLEKLQAVRNLIDVNHSEKGSKNTALHFSLKYADNDKSEELLKLGASLASKNSNGVMPVQNIEPELLEKHLDNCIEFNESSRGTKKEDFPVTFNYRTLIPPCETQKSTLYKNDIEAKLNDSLSQELVAETEVIYYMSKAQEFKHLLKHPVIVSFLFMKWHKIRLLFLTNLAFYVVFTASLLTYIFSSYVNFSNEEPSGFVKFLSGLSYTLLFITFWVLLIRELFQLIVSTQKYLTDIENLLEIILIVVAAYILFASSSDEAKKQFSSIAILLSALELVLMIGQHPKLSTNVVMLKTVSVNFFKFFLWYSLLIIAFALSFYIIFTDANEESPSNATETEDENLFTNPGKSVFKTIIMLTGEFDASSINFQTFPILSKIIFALFIFMIAIILLNLLNGLAVSDTQMIKNDAELVGHIARAQHIRYVESMLLGNILPMKIINYIQGLCCCLPSYKIIMASPLARKYCCLFPHLLNYELTIYPNKYGEIALPKASRNRGLLTSDCLNCSKIYLDKETVRRTNAIIQARREEMKTKNQTNHYDKLEKLISIQQNNIEELRYIIDNIFNNSVE